MPRPTSAAECSCRPARPSRRRSPPCPPRSPPAGPTVRLGLGAENSGMTSCTAGCATRPSRPTAAARHSCSRCTRSSCRPGLENELFQLRVGGDAAGHGAPRTLRRHPARRRPGRTPRPPRRTDGRSRRARRRARPRGDEDGAQAGAGRDSRTRPRRTSIVPTTQRGSPPGWRGFASSSGPRCWSRCSAENTRRLLAGEMPEAPLRAWPTTSARPAARPLRRSRLP